MKIILHLEVNETELKGIEDDTEDEIKIKLYDAMCEWLKEIDDWGQVFDYKPS